MYKLLLLTALVSNCCCYIMGNNTNPVQGARSSALGGSCVTFNDLFSAVNNQAGLATIKDISAGFFYENRFLIPQLGLKSVALVLPVKTGTFGLSINTFGYQLYSENKYGLAYAKALSEKLSIGIQLSYLYTHINEAYSNCRSIAAEIGIQAQLTANLRLGVHLFNPTHHKFTAYTPEHIPTILRLGLQYVFNKNVIVVIETEKDIDWKPLFKAGLEYHVIPHFYLGAGITPDPAKFSFGFGTQLARLKLDVAATYHNLLGFSPTVTCSYQFLPH